VTVDVIRCPLVFPQEVLCDLLALSYDHLWSMAKSEPPYYVWWLLTHPQLHHPASPLAHPCSQPINSLLDSLGLNCMSKNLWWLCLDAQELAQQYRLATEGFDHLSSISLVAMLLLSHSWFNVMDMEHMHIAQKIYTIPLFLSFCIVIVEIMYIWHIHNSCHIGEHGLSS